MKAATYAALGGFLSWGFTTVAAAAKSPMTSIRDFFVFETAFTASAMRTCGRADDRAVLAVTFRSWEWKSSNSSAQGGYPLAGARLAV